MGIGGLAPLIDQLTSYLLHSPNYIFSIFSGLNDKNSSIVIWNSLETNEQKKTVSFSKRSHMWERCMVIVVFT